MGCPPHARLLAHARDELAPAEATRLDGHLSDCGTCLDTYIELGKNAPMPKIPGCHVVKELGRGRFGVVYKAWWLEERPRLVALKILSNPGDMEVSRFDREIAVLRKIRSPGIVRCLGSGESGKLRYLMMDYVEGRHLDEIIKDRSLSLIEKLEVFRHICRAVADAHDQGVVHRDLKPSNILVDATGRPHILDFGICTVRPSDWSSLISATITHAGDIIGTLKYMSPEQAWGGVAEKIGRKSDIWSLGIMLYETVTGGGYPYPIGPYRDRSTPEALLERIRKELPDRPDLSHLPRGTDLETLLQRCLAWEPDHRIASVRKLGDDITRYVYGQPTRTRPVWWPRRMRRLAVGAAARSRLAFHAVFVALCGLILWMTTITGSVGWLVEGKGSAPSGADKARTAFFQDATANTLIVGIGDETHLGVRAFAKEHGLDSVERDVRSWRAVHGALMNRLVDARPIGVVWDYYFRSDRPADAALADGIMSLQRANIPVILGALTYDEDGIPAISHELKEQLADRLRCGAIVARDMVKRPGDFIMAFRHADQTPIPTLPLATYAALLRPEARLEVEWSERDKHLRLLYEIEPHRYLRRRDRVSLGDVFQQLAPKYGIENHDLVGTSTFMLEAPEVWAARTVRYEQLLDASPEELARRAGGKLLIFGDLRTARLGMLADRHTIKYETEVISGVPGCYLVGDAIDGLVRGAYVQTARLLETRTVLIMLLLAAGGCWLPVPLANWAVLGKRSHQRVLWMGLLGVSIACYGLMLVSKSFTAVHTVMSGFSLLAPMAGSFWVEFARNRHRVLDNRRRAIVDRSINVDGTLTLEPMPSL